jgi:hypothetical protein
MNSDAEKMLEMIDQIRKYQDAQIRAKEYHNHKRYVEFCEDEQTAKQEFVSALISLIDERISQQLSKGKYE